MGDDLRTDKCDTADTPRAADKLGRLVDALPAGLRQEFQEIWRPLVVAAGDVLIEEGDEPTDVGYVVEGLLGMVKELPDGRRHIIGLLAPSDLYGRALDGPAGYHVEALTNAKVHVCDGARLEDILGRSPEAERLFLADLLDEIDAAREWLLVLSSPKVVQRVASFLVILSRHKPNNPEAAAGPKDQGPVNLQIAVRRADLARYLGVRPESLSRAFHDLEDERIIRINDPYDIDLLDLARLVEMAGHDLTIRDPR